MPISTTCYLYLNKTAHAMCTLLSTQPSCHTHIDVQPTAEVQAGFHKKRAGLNWTCESHRRVWHSAGPAVQADNHLRARRVMEPVENRQFYCAIKCSIARRHHGHHAKPCKSRASPPLVLQRPLNSLFPKTTPILDRTVRFVAAIDIAIDIEIDI